MTQRIENEAANETVESMRPSFCGLARDPHCLATRATGLGQARPACGPLWTLPPPNVACPSRPINASDPLLCLLMF